MTGLVGENLVVTPEYLEMLAREQDAAERLAKDAKRKTEDVEKEVWLTYGSFSNSENRAFTHVEHARHDAVDRIQSRCRDLAAMLRAAADQYASTNAVLASNLDKQMLPATG